MEVIKKYDNTGNVSDKTYLINSDGTLEEITLSGKWIYKEIDVDYGMPWIVYEAYRAR